MPIGHSHLRAFHAVARQHGFSAAARQLGVSQPSVSTLVKELEERFGVRLFLRQGREVRPTELGERLLRVTNRYFDAESEAYTLLAEAGALRSGLLRVAAVGPFHAVEMLAAFHRRYPSVTVEMMLGDSKEVLEKVLRYECEIGVLAQLDAHEELAVFPYREHPVMLILPAGHPLARHASLRLEQLAGQPLIFRERGSTTRRLFEQALLERNVAVRVAMQIGSREAIREAVAQGLGISFVSAREHVPDPRIKLLPISDVEITTNAQVICLKERLDTQLVGAFVEVVRELQSGAG
ncbi:LysR family transcriptional regulator [Solimonas sp. K1W22B-7]|uniref:LysR substrate-binding domain-containing protein n=1 Tax=Solimonas sp. K1W22B-7 TaxID=2303331 RepID=UPI000E3342F6|nr:LysR substrate-binding domain-containing protein [Solimonas sp. K1W22B-7]AXQ28915.1 LysR family transcriptional regulator [Solimonas sp. K1W22B-7]